MSPLEKKKLQVELMKVTAAKGELELRIEERNEEIKRIIEHVAVQDKRIKELETELKGMEE